MHNPEAEFSDGKLRVYFCMMSEGGAMVEWDNVAADWRLFEIPLYGGEPRFVQSSTDLHALITIGESWT